MAIWYRFLVRNQNLHFLTSLHFQHVYPARLNHAGQESKQAVELMVEPFFHRPDDILHYLADRPLRLVHVAEIQRTRNGVCGPAPVSSRCCWSVDDWIILSCRDDCTPIRKSGRHSSGVLTRSPPLF